MVVLPDPLAPISPTMAPGSAVKLTPSTARTPPKATARSAHLEPGRARRRMSLVGPSVDAAPPRLTPAGAGSRPPARPGRGRLDPSAVQQHPHAEGDQVADAVQELGQAAGQVQDEGQQPEAAGEELDGRVGAEDGRQAHQVDGAQHGAGDGAQAADDHHGDDQERDGRVERGRAESARVAKARHTPA